MLPYMTYMNLEPLLHSWINRTPFDLAVFCLALFGTKRNRCRFGDYVQQLAANRGRIVAFSAQFNMAVAVVYTPRQSS